MAFRINRGIFQFLDTASSRYINKFKIDDISGDLVEVDPDTGDAVTGYLRVGDKASDANLLDGIDSTSFVRTTNNSSLNTDSRNTRGVTRLYRRDDNSDYNLQHYWTGSYWYLKGYSGDTYHAGVQVAYADYAANSNLLDGVNSTSFVRSDADNSITGKLTVSNDFKVDNGRILITNSSGTGGGNFDPTTLAYTAREQTYGRAQLLLASGYSDITIGSSQANDNHGSTLTFATVNPSNAADYKKFVIGQGNWGARAGFLDFGYDSGSESKNPHNYINSADVVFTIDADNNRVGINNMSPGRTLDVSGDIYASSWVRVGGNQGIYFQSYGGGWNMTDTTWIRSYGSKPIYIDQYVRADQGFEVNGHRVINSSKNVNAATSVTIGSYTIQQNAAGDLEFVF